MQSARLDGPDDYLDLAEHLREVLDDLAELGADTPVTAQAGPSQRVNLKPHGGHARRDVVMHFAGDVREILDAFLADPLDLLREPGGPGRESGLAGEVDAEPPLASPEALLRRACLDDHGAHVVTLVSEGKL